MFENQIDSYIYCEIVSSFYCLFEYSSQEKVERLKFDITLYYQVSIHICRNNLSYRNLFSSAHQNIYNFVCIKCLLSGKDVCY